MQRVDEKLANALIRLGNDPDFVHVHQWLTGNYRCQLVENVDLTGEAGVRGQGAAKVLQEITDIFDNPRELAEKLKQGAARAASKKVGR